MEENFRWRNEGERKGTDGSIRGQIFVLVTRVGDDEYINIYNADDYDQNIKWLGK